MSDDPTRSTTPPHDDQNDISQTDIDTDPTGTPRDVPTDIPRTPGLEETGRAGTPPAPADADPGLIRATPDVNTDASGTPVPPAAVDSETARTPTDMDTGPAGRPRDVDTSTPTTSRVPEDAVPVQQRARVAHDIEESSKDDPRLMGRLFDFFKSIFGREKTNVSVAETDEGMMGGPRPDDPHDNP
jgi:hypothetical protein